SAIADVLGSMPAPFATARLRAMLDDPDKRVVPAVLDSLTKLKAPGIETLLLEQIKAADTGIRASAARNLGVLRPAAGAAVLREAYQASQTDDGADAREASLVALSRYGLAEAGETVKAALADRDWALRLRA